MCEPQEKVRVLTVILPCGAGKENFVKGTMKEVFYVQDHAG